MALNPIVFTEKVMSSFLRYQLTAYPFADPRMNQQMRQLLSLDQTRNSPLLQGPYISLSRPFKRGASIASLVEEGILHPLMRQRIPDTITHLYAHQEAAVRAIHLHRTTLVATGTGSGKTECFLYPIVSHCLKLRDLHEPAGISAVIVYPMNALAEDQLARLRGLLAGTGVRFGMYVGKTPEFEREVAGIRLAQGASKADYEARLAQATRGESVYPAEEVCSREMMRTPGEQPRILLTNVNQLELLLTRQKDTELFANARLDFMVFDEAHTFTGAQGAETACLIRRLRAFCNRSAADTICVATSATIADPNNPNAARDFAARFFGVEPQRVATISETYEQEVWANQQHLPRTPKVDPAKLLQECVEAVDAGEVAAEQVANVYRALTTTKFAPGDQSWEEHLFHKLRQNELVRRLSELLAHPKPLDQLPKLLEAEIGREVTEEEILTWLTLGAAARNQERPLLRPVVHAFVRGISGGVVSFPQEMDEPKLLLAAEDEDDAQQPPDAEDEVDTPEQPRYAHFPVLACTTCGQHYFVAWLNDFEFFGSMPSGGTAVGDAYYWEPLDETRGGGRVVLLDRIVGGTEENPEEGQDRLHKLFFCRHCGACHPEEVSRCLHCGVSSTLVPLLAIKSKEDSEGMLSSCVCCKATGRRSAGGHYREPARPVRATNVADVHVLAQDMIHHSERPRLLVFCDNRQEAAFQAGWMKDHARRFRLQALMADGLAAGNRTIGDLVLHLEQQLESDEALSRALIPEVWTHARKEGSSGGRHHEERKKYLRIQVLRELVTSSRQPIGLEPWGRMMVTYEGLVPATDWIQRHARRLGMPADELCNGVGCLLDSLRRKKVLFDLEYEIFTKYWANDALAPNYLPPMGPPVGTKLFRGYSEKADYVTQWLSERGDTTIRQMLHKWGVPTDEVEEFAKSLFDFLRELDLLVKTLLKGQHGKALPGVSEVYQVNADRVRMQPNSGVYRCTTCRRRIVRRPPGDLCPAWRCDGKVEFVREDPDNYDLQMLDQGYSMLRPEEHTAMVPHADRERLENLFKGNSQAVNTFVCTPTLELGVDIGKLDAVLMRNVPPLPANYWQRAGRAGRRHRMAVILTYCRSVSHDRAYFANPLKLLEGRIDPPAFNLRNDFMVAKHVHAAVITRLHQLARAEERTRQEREEIGEVLRAMLPRQISGYLFQDSRIRQDRFDLKPLGRLIQREKADLLQNLQRVFTQGWPKADQDVVSNKAMEDHLDRMADSLSEVVRRLEGRLNWAMDQIQQLHARQREHGTLDRADQSMLRRCERLVQRLKGERKRGRGEAEGYDEANTFGVLAAEGFLPGYGLEVGSIVATAEAPYWATSSRWLSLPRPPSTALREYVPGNVIYANGNRYVTRQLQRDAREEDHDRPVFEVSLERKAVRQMLEDAPVSTLGGSTLNCVAVCDVQLEHASQISDEEEIRFQMGVAIYGYELDQHDGGNAYNWGAQGLHMRRGVRLRLVNVGPNITIKRDGTLGYPVCTVCGQALSPLASESAIAKFVADHKERCGKTPRNIGFFTDVVADVVSLPECPDQNTAYSILEAVRMGATQVLDMHLDDLQILVINKFDRKEVDALLWDPMPGGSGLLLQLIQKFDEIIEAAIAIVEQCPAKCASSCIDCLQTFRNSYYHEHLLRESAAKRFKEWGRTLQFSHRILPKRPEKGIGEPVNDVEWRLRYMLERAGFGKGSRGEQIDVGRPIGTTTPDVIYRGPSHNKDEGVCIYLDGMSQHIHGNPQTRAKDLQIRDALRRLGWEVIEIAANELSDPQAMTRHFRKLARYLENGDLREKLTSDPTWFDATTPPHPESAQPQLEFVDRDQAEPFIHHLPLVPIQAAAGGFSEPQTLPDENWEHWVRVDSTHPLHQGMFVAQVTGHSMEPKIPDGAYCIFSAPVTGTRQGKILLVQLLDNLDPETNQRYTVKQYTSQKTQSPDTPWRHLSITLKPLNPDYPPIHLTTEDEAEVSVIAELMSVLPHRHG